MIDHVYEQAIADLEQARAELVRLREELRISNHGYEDQIRLYREMRTDRDFWKVGHDAAESTLTALLARVEGATDPPQDANKELIEELNEQVIEASGQRRWCKVCNFEWRIDDSVNAPDHGPDCLVPKLIAALALQPQDATTALIEQWRERAAETLERAESEALVDDPELAQSLMARQYERRQCADELEAALHCPECGRLDADCEKQPCYHKPDHLAALSSQAPPQEKKEGEIYTRVDVGTQPDRPSASTGSTASDNKLPPALKTQMAGILRRLREAGWAASERSEFNSARAFHYACDDLAALFDMVLEHQAWIDSLESAPAGDAVDPVSRDSSERPRATESPDSASQAPPQAWPLDKK